MNKMKLLSIAFAAILMFISCSKEESKNEPIPAGEDAVLSLKLAGEKSKATGVDGTTEDNKINDINVFIFRKDGMLDVAATYHDNLSGLTVANIVATTAASEVCVIANYGEKITTDIKKKADLADITGDLANATGTTQKKDNLFMEGTGTIGWTGTKGAATVKLEFVGARITIKVDLTGFKNPAGNNHITIGNVVLLHAGAKANFFAADEDARGSQTAFYSGDIDYTGFTRFEVTPTEKSFLAEALTFTDETGNTPDYPYGAMTTDKPHFYTFVNNLKKNNSGTTNPANVIILALRGTRGGKEIFWPIHFDGVDKEKIESKNSYNVTIKLTGDTSDGGNGGGTETPEIPLVPGSVDVTVEKATWTAKLIEKEFN